MSGQVPQDDNNPNPHNVPDPPGQVDYTVQQIVTAVKGDTETEFNDMVAAKQLSGLWRHNFRILQGPVPLELDLGRKTTTKSKNPTQRSNRYPTMKDLDPKKDKAANPGWQVDKDGQKLKRDTLKDIIDRLRGAGLLGQYNGVVRVCPFNADQTQNHDGCGCGCNS
jgi:hypothetical protein